MSQTLTLHLTDAVYAALREQAEASGTSPADLAVRVLQREYGGNGSWTEAEKQAARARFERHFGAVNLGHPTGVDNEAIDADLAREYADTHEEK